MLKAAYSGYAGLMRISRAIHVCMTGGTIDSEYIGAVDTVLPHRKSVLPAFFKNLRIKRRMKFSPICMKDSRELTAADRKLLLDRIEDSPYRRVLVGHGTYTMAETAEYLNQKVVRRDQVIVLTGSLVPLTGVSPSDSTFNLGYAVAQLDLLRPGVYICFNGDTYRPARFEMFGHLANTELQSRYTR